jgi:chromosome segregation ATPase
VFAVFVCNVPSDDDDGDNNAVKITQSNRGRRRKAKIGKRWRQPLGDISKIQAQNDQTVIQSTKRTPSDGDDIRVLSKDLAANHAKATGLSRQNDEPNPCEIRLMDEASSLARETHDRDVEGYDAIVSELDKATHCYNQLKADNAAAKEMISQITEHLKCIKAVYDSELESHVSLIQETNKLRQATEHFLKVTKEENSQLKATMLFKDLAITALKEEVATIKGKYDILASDHANVKRDYESRINQKDDELNNSNAQITQYQVLFPR